MSLSVLAAELVGQLGLVGPVGPVGLVGQDQPIVTAYLRLSVCLSCLELFSRLFGTRAKRSLFLGVVGQGA